MAARPRKPGPRREPAPTTPDPVEIAMEAVASGREPAGVAQGLLQDHRRLVGWQIASERAGVALKVLTGLAGLAIAVLLAVMAWTAHEKRGLSIAAFRAPPELVARGLDGVALAGRMQDLLQQMQAETNNYDSGLAVRNAVDAGVRVEIPTTGISLGDLQRLMSDLFGHETDVTAEVFRPLDPKAPQALGISIRVGAGPGVRIIQADGEVEALMVGAAEQVYRGASPIAYAVWLSQHGRSDDSLALLRQIAASGEVSQRVVALTRLADTERGEKRRPFYRAALQLDPRYYPARMNLATVDRDVGDEEAGLRNIERAGRDSRGRATPGLKLLIALNTTYFRADWSGAMALRCGDYQVSPCTAEVLVDAAMMGQPVSAASDRQKEARPATAVQALAERHETRAAARWAAAVRPDVSTYSAAYQTAVALGWLNAEAVIARNRGDWPGMLRIQDAADLLAQAQYAGQFLPGNARTRALALAHLGRFAEAEAAIAPTPLINARSLVVRGQVAELKGDRAGADHWFAEAVRVSASLPQARTEWARVLLDRGEVERALPLLKAAHKATPSFADPLELWGEALLAQGDAKAAATKFAQAASTAPDWGRLHLRWAQALARAGKTDEARSQRSMAESLDLTPAERAELNGWRP